MKRILIKNADVFDGFSAEIKKHASIVIDGNLIETVTTSEVQEEGFAEVIDAKGLTAIPGLVEGHGHLTAFSSKLERDQMREDEIVVHSVRRAHDLLLNGITTVRDAGSLIYGLKKGIDDGIIDGPRIFPSNAALSQTCGHADCRTNHAEINTILGPTSPFMRAGIMTTCDGAGEISKVVREQFFLGASQIKLMTGGGMSTVMDPIETLQFTLEEQKLIVGLARDYGTYVMAHLYTPEQIKRSAKAGILSFEHASFMDEDSSKMIADIGGWICPCPNSFPEGLRENMSRMPPNKRYFVENFEDALKKQSELINKYNLDHIIFGTDGTADPPKQLYTYQERFGALNGLRMATGNAKRLFELCTYQNPYPEGYIGTIEKGSYADILLVDGDPVHDLYLFNESKNIKLIMKDGKVYKKE
ncbi:amidohydrolase family protein [Clostridium sp. chh4-2]|uniref:metal-dependent hydrolase family protein n=1 Tax=Clostridium sp. chh4-2 TaxID=2067550 RepID=UPI000CCDC545|nr:amidohydrolase family protein [Clostridium sp. chh4-2]PNV63552.1 amidohydrolase family protein [Clostridium sp. chh4-2]